MYVRIVKRLFLNLNKMYLPLGDDKVGIQECKNCGTKFKYKDFFKLLWPKTSVDCKNCGATHEITRLSSFFITALMLIPAFSMINLLPSILLRLLVFFLWVVVLAVLSPFIARFKLKDNSENKE